LSVFGKYAPWYDLLYQDKDYFSETSFVEQQLRRHGSKSGTLLDLGCGTGAHATEFSRRGWNVTGVDLSEDMINQAKARLAGDTPRVTFRLGNACRPGPERDFDAVISLFHVASYQTSNADLRALLSSARAALKSDGVLLFDYWYGGAALAQGVETRVKVVERDPLRVTRIAQSTHDKSKNTVEVNYTLFCEDKSKVEIHRIDESHHMRYWFPFEIEVALKSVGLGAVGHFAWMSTDAPDSQNWGAYTVAKPTTD
jgi:SAM-dependent methyltransferase